MLRTSSYVIYVDLPHNEEDMLLVHGYSGAYDKVSCRVATYLRSLETGHPPKPLYGEWSPEPAIEGQTISPTEETINVLKRRGYLTQKTVEEESALFEKMVSTLHNSASHRAPRYFLMPTYNCNLRCPYCYQDHMRSNPAFRHLLDTTMQPELVDRLFEAMPQINAHHGVPDNGHSSELSIGFYGGEPLLAQNRPIIEYVINKALAQDEARFSAITNATELHAYRDLLGPEKISSLQITLDGPPTEHDQRRIYADGSGSFERIASNITLALDLGVRVSLRMNIDRNNIHQLPELADEIVARGWDGYRRFSTHTSAISAANEKTDVKTTMSPWKLDKALTETCQQYPNMQVIRRPSDRLKDQIRGIFDRQEKPSLKPSFCGAHTSAYILDPFGDLYVCWERTGDPQIRIGHISQEGDLVLNSEVEQIWRSRTVACNPTCSQCRYALYCGGGCAARALDRYNEFFTNYCNSFAARFRDSTAQAYLDFMAGIQPMAQQDQGCEV